MDENNRISSFTAANSFPVKIIQNMDLMEKLSQGYIPPYHVQLNPTNVCTFHCDFCSCKNREKSDRLGKEETLHLIDTLSELGCGSITLTGGGEPTLFPFLDDIIERATSYGIDVGLVTNGSYKRPDYISPEILNKVTWCRISCSDILPQQIDVEQWFTNVITLVVQAPKVDWSFSYVIGKNPNIFLLSRIINFANDNNFTHVRIVSNLLDLDNTPDMDNIKCLLTKERKLDDSKIIYQGRKKFTHGAKKCYISLLKPVVGAEGGLYPCCGTQYALDTPSLDYEKTMKMGEMNQIKKFYDKQKPFDGSKCVKCYYNEYNDLLSRILNKTEHKRFV
jgi:hypothetical protein